MDYSNKIDGYNFTEIYTQIKIINDEINHYDTEIYKPRFAQNAENYKTVNSRENYEKVIIPVFKNTSKQHENSIHFEHSISSKNASPNKEQTMINANNNEFTNKDNELDSLNDKVNENIQQLYDTLNKNGLKNDKKNTKNIMKTNNDNARNEK